MILWEKTVTLLTPVNPESELERNGMNVTERALGPGWFGTVDRGLA